MTHLTTKKKKKFVKKNIFAAYITDKALVFLCANSPMIREMKIEAILRSHHLSDWWKPKSTTGIVAGKAIGKQAFSYIARGNARWESPS